LLEGRRATTHWASCETLAERYPAVAVERDPIFVRDGNIYTSAGVTAGMDLALALVEEDLGRRTALEVARWLVLFVKRPGGQSQFSSQLAAQAADREPLRELQEWIAGHLDADLSVPALARRAHMSERNFARAFRRELGMTPGAYVEVARVEAARIALETTAAPVEAVARDAGFGTVETMRRAFHRRLGVGPAAYRARFTSTRAA
jgi:transcriptional regulator GlxA family with amidase domain